MLIKQLRFQCYEVVGFIHWFLKKAYKIQKEPNALFHIIHLMRAAYLESVNFYLFLLKGKLFNLAGSTQSQIFAERHTTTAYFKSGESQAEQQKKSVP